MTYTPRLVELEGKHPAEILDYSIGFSRWLADAETIAYITSVTADAGLTIAAGPSPPAPAISGSDVVFWCSGGTSGTTYDVEVVVVTSGGRTLIADLQITVTDPTP